jgi:hypothetical protein
MAWRVILIVGVAVALVLGGVGAYEWQLASYKLGPPTDCRTIDYGLTCSRIPKWATYHRGTAELFWYGAGAAAVLTIVLVAVVAPCTRPRASTPSRGG